MSNSSFLGDSLCILSPRKSRESAFFKLGEVSHRSFRLLNVAPAEFGGAASGPDDDTHEPSYVAQLVLHVSGSDEVIRPSLIALTPVPKKPSMFSLRVNLGPKSQLLEAIEPHLSIHHSTSVQADISIYELIAVTRQVFSRSSSDGVLEDAAAGAGKIGRRSSLRRSLSATAGKRCSFLEVPHEHGNPDEGGHLSVPGSFPPPGGSPSLANVSRFSSSSTLVSSSSDGSVDGELGISPLGSENSKLRSWLCTRKDRSSILVRRVTQRIRRARSVRHARRAEAAAGDDKTTLTTTNLLKLDAGRWERDGDADADALTDIGRSAMSATSSSSGSDDASSSESGREGSMRVTSAASSWVSSVSLGSQMSEAVSVARGEKMAEGGSIEAGLACAAQVTFAGTVR